MGLNIGDLLGKVDLGDIPKILELYLKYKPLVDELLKKQTKPSLPPAPTPIDPPDDGDVIPNPVTPKKAVVSGRLGVVWMQLSRARFPEFYTPQNQYGLLPRGQVEAILSGESALSFESAVRFDSTFFDADGKEILPEDVHRLGLAWRSRWTVKNGDEESFLEGQGSTYVNAKGKQEAFVKEEGAGETGVGQGTRNYTDTLGFGQRMDFYKEGEFEIFLEIAGVRTNSLKFKVS